MKGAYLWFDRSKTCCLCVITLTMPIISQPLQISNHLCDLGQKIILITSIFAQTHSNCFKLARKQTSYPEFKFKTTYKKQTLPLKEWKMSSFLLGTPISSLKRLTFHFSRVRASLICLCLALVLVGVIILNPPTIIAEEMKANSQAFLH